MVLPAVMKYRVSPAAIREFVVLATTAEVNRAIASLESQAQRMQARAKQVRAVLNGAGRGAA